MQYYYCYDALVAAKRLTVGRVYNVEKVFAMVGGEGDLTRLESLELVSFYGSILRGP